jgi:hypothetical protein
MDVNAVTSIIGSLGFPIFACVAMFWYLNKERESHAEEIDILRTSLDKNTEILEKLKDIIQYLDRRKD